MGWEVVKKQFGEQTKYKIWSNVSDGYITPKWLTRDEITKFFFWERLRGLMETFMKDAMTFPSEYCEKGNFPKRFYDKEATDAYSAFMNKAVNDAGGEVLVAAFSEELKKHGISFSVSDGKYGFEIE